MKSIAEECDALVTSMMERPGRKTDPGANVRLHRGEEKIQLAILDCQRSVDAINELLQVVRNSWFVHDPPDRERVQAIGAELSRLELELRSGIRELRVAVSPTRP